MDNITETIETLKKTTENGFLADRAKLVNKSSEQVIEINKVFGFLNSYLKDFLSNMQGYNFDLMQSRLDENLFDLNAKVDAVSNFLQDKQNFFIGLSNDSSEIMQCFRSITASLSTNMKVLTEEEKQQAKKNNISEEELLENKEKTISNQMQEYFECSKTDTQNIMDELRKSGDLENCIINTQSNESIMESIISFFRTKFYTQLLERYNNDYSFADSTINEIIGSLTKNQSALQDITSRISLISQSHENFKQNTSENVRYIEQYNQKHQTKTNQADMGMTKNMQ